MPQIIADDARWVSRLAYVDRDIYELEQERVFGHAWLFLGHESQIEREGDFIAAYIGERPVIVSRGPHAILRAFVNACPHCGKRVSWADKGNTRVFTCGCGRTYDSTGTFLGAPGINPVEGNYDLTGVAQVDAYKGLMFGSLDSQAPRLREYLGDAAMYMDILLDRRAGGTEAKGVQRWRMRSNWKIDTDNHAGDFYHAAYTHGSLGRIKNLGKPRWARGDRRQVIVNPGHYLLAYPSWGDPERFFGNQHATELQNDYLRDMMPEAIERLGADRANMAYLVMIYPNFGFIVTGGVNDLRVYHPRGPEELEVWNYCLVDTDAPDDVKDAITKRHSLIVGPTGMAEQDDGENFTQVSASSRGRLARHLEFTYAMGAGHEILNEEFPGASHVNKEISEGNQRGFYMRWAADMGYLTSNS